MAPPYLEQLQAIVERSSLPGSAAADLVCKHFFSGAAAYVGGRIFMSLTAVGLALKLPAEARDELFALGAKPLKYFPKAPVKKEYAVLPPQIVADEPALAGWILRSAKYVGGAPV